MQRVSSERDPLRDGRLAILAGALAWSTAGVIQRTLTTDEATQIAGRAAFAAVTLLLVTIALERRGTVRAFLGMGLSGLVIAATVAIASGTFVLALNHTSVANVLFMQAVGPFLAALLGWLWLRERVARRTWLAMAVALAGVAVMVGGPGSGSSVGHLLAFGMTLSFAASIVLTRHRREVSMAPAVCVSQVLVVVVVAPFSHPGSLEGLDLLLTGAMGGGQIGLGLLLFVVGARLIPPAEVAVISLLEVVLGPLWVWLAYGEEPETATLVGGVVVLAAVAIQTVGDLRAAPPPRAADGDARR